VSAPLSRRLLFVLVGIVLLSLNLRPAAVSIGPVLAEVRAGLGMNATSAGLLTSLPVLAFAVFGALAPGLAARIGLHRVTLLALLCVVVGLGTRVLVSHEAAFLALSMLALAGMAVANVVLPSLVKLHFPDRVGPVTAIYTTALSTGLTAALWLTVPLSHALGDWRDGLGVWAVMALVAAVPWLGLVSQDRHLERPDRTIRYGEVLRTRLGIAMALFFGFQSLQAYVVFGWFATLWRDAGYSATDAGLLVGLVAATAIPLSFWAPRRLAAAADPRALLFAIMACYLVGYGGLVVAPHSLAVVWALFVGAGTTTFPLILTLVGLRARTPAGTAALSSVTQSLGYLIAVGGPFTFGAVHDATDGWTWPLLLLLATVLPLFVVGAYVSRPMAVEDQLKPARGGRGRPAAPAGR
jgi:CP family cyanate transporter-like MFS transporter